MLVVDIIQEADIITTITHFFTHHTEHFLSHKPHNKSQPYVSENITKGETPPSDNKNDISSQETQHPSHPYGPSPTPTSLGDVI
ncbi:hypothetical protein Hamer_G000637 [Homarus americanus]|uniref:Uncharacterized protein n=1 Tax=Homarus americanus TaxID=6706 RepID=A0A8J5NCZ1_HOMAM|nr:hypothetical protein Hamer_G000637 [Homarus americanus]